LGIEVPHDFVRYLKVGRYPLDVVIILEEFDRAH